MAAKLAAGSLPPEKAAVAPQLIFNQHLDAWLTAFFVVLLWVIVLDMLRVSARHLAGKPCHRCRNPRMFPAGWSRILRATDP